MTSLLTRLESLTTPSREVSDELLLSWGWRCKTVDAPLNETITLWRNGRIAAFDEWSAFPPHPTAFVDDARLGVPEGVAYSVDYRADYRDETTALVGEHMARIAGDNPAIALCIAIVKERGGV